MKKKIVNLIQLLLLLVSFLILNVPCIKFAGYNNAVSFLIYYQTLTEKISFLPTMPIYVLYILCAVMCIVSIVSKSSERDGLAHGVATTLLFTYCSICTLTGADYTEMAHQIGFNLISYSFSTTPYIILMFIIVVISFAKRSSVFSDKTKTQLNVDNNTLKLTTPDEIKKYKELLDTGAISLEEYDKKKNELLNL